MDITGTATIYDLLVERTAEHADMDYLVFVGAESDTTNMTYQEFVESVDRFATGLHREGIGQGSGVILHMRTGLEFLSCWFALAKIGAISVPTNLASAPPELAHAIAKSNAEFVITETSFMETFELATQSRDVQIRKFIVKGAEGGSAGTTPLDRIVESHRDEQTSGHADIDSTAVAEILFTSGTTALPKGAQLTHANLIRAGYRVAHHYQLDHDDRVLSMLPLFHVGGQAMGVMCALVAGSTCVLVERYSASSFWDQVKEHRPTFAMVVPTHVRTLLAQEAKPDDRDHTLSKVAFGLKITDEERSLFEDRFNIRLTYCYGQTEAILLIAIAPLTGDRHWPAVGLPAFDRNVRVVDADGEDVPVGEVGEVIVEADPGRTVMLGYANDPEATENTIREGWLYTGDYASFDSRGFLHFADRKKDMIKRAGENVSALEVETVLTAHPLIDDAAVIGIPDPIRDEAVKAFVVISPGKSLSDEDIGEHCRKHLSAFKIPTVIEYRESLPKTSIGKTIKQELRQSAGN